MTQNYPSRVPSRIINPFVFCRQPNNPPPRGPCFDTTLASW
jgi:hypothetical protein